jgi:phosphatidylserine decarboxylase
MAEAGTMKVAPEGIPFIGFFAVATAAVFFFANPFASIVPLGLLLFMLYFFRDPERDLPDSEGFISPADGRVISIVPQFEREYLKCNAMRISIFMSPLNVHVNRAPCDGEVLNVKHTPGSFKAAYRESASLKNENTAMLMKNGAGNILVRQVAGFVARRTVCRVSPGEVLKRGERFGLIKFSSRVDIFLPCDVDVLVRPNDKVKAGVTLLAQAKA